MKNFKFFKCFLLLVILFQITSCTDNDDQLTTTPDNEVKTFVWKGLNYFYLWQDKVADLSDTKFTNQKEIIDYMAQKDAPENLFQSLLFKPRSLFPANESVDKFSILVNDYAYLENLFQGIRTTSGLVLGFTYTNGNSGDFIGFVKYVVPGSDAASKNIKRGDLFYAVDNVLLTETNYRNAFANDNFTLNLADFNVGVLTPNGNSIAFTKTQITENPVFINKMFAIGSKKIAYLMYNSFTSNFNLELNNAFGQIAASNATDLVLDLRYNGGGSIQTAVYLSSMITGQFNNQVFAREIWNNKLQSYFQANNPETLIDRFTNNINGVAINNLNLSKIYILTSQSTASASELLINGLKPYITVVQIGDTTIGKNVGSVTVYDSINFGKSGANPNHKYAMQPLVLKVANKDGFGDYQSGLKPDNSNTLIENFANLGILGDVNEPLLARALSIIGVKRKTQNLNSNNQIFKIFDEASFGDFNQEMYLDKVPEGFDNAVK